MKPTQWGKRRMSDKESPSADALQQPKSPQAEQQGAPEGAYVPEIIEVVENNIYFYSDIDREKILRLNRTIHTLNNDLLYRSIVTKNKPAEIYLYVNSHGGSIFDAFSVIDTILNSRIPINTIIDGCAASAATLLTIVGKKRYIKKHSYFMIHQLSSFMFGKYTDFQDEMENLDKFMDMLRVVYKRYTKIPMAKLNEILKHDIWFNSEEAVKFGLVDVVLEDNFEDIN